MGDETVSMTRFTIRYPNGIGGKDSPAWSFPPVCVCCGAPAQDRSPLHIETSTGTARVWMDLKVPYCGTCMGHIAPRVSEGSAAKILGTILGFAVGLGLVGVFWGMGHEPFAHKGWDWYMFSAIMAGVVTACGVQSLATYARTRSGGTQLPRTGDCTLALHAEMTGGSQIWLDMGNSAAAQAFREAHPGIGETEAIRVRAERTPRGDLVYKERVSDKA